MEKRTLIAFVLSMVVLLAWAFLFAPKQEQKTGGAPETETVSQMPAPSGRDRPLREVKTVPPPQASEQSPERPAAKPVPQAIEKNITVETPLYRAVFSNVGPSVKSFKLKHYRQTMEPDSPLIEMLSQESQGVDFLLIDFGRGPLAGNGKLVCTADRDRVTVSEEGPPGNLVFRSVSPEGLSITRTYRFYPDQYQIDLTVDVRNDTETTVEAPFKVRISALPPEKKSYYAYVGLLALVDDELEELKVKKVSEDKRLTGNFEWVAYEHDFFISAMIPEVPARGSFTGSLLPSGLLNGAFATEPVSVGPSQTVGTDFILYFGPRDLGILRQLGMKLERAVNFGWTDIIAKPLLYALRFFNQYLGNYGLSIILLTILIKILFWPLTHKSYKSMKEMQKLQPRMAKLREKYKGNKEQLNKELMGLYKTYKVNPMGGCLPMVIQIPVFFALFRILGNSIELRQAPFILWINDLSAPDRLFNFPFSIPFMSPPYGIPILTLLMGASMFLQQKMSPKPGDPTQAKLMMFLPIIFTFMFINFPSGLVLYWLVNNLLSIGQQYRINKSRK
ncbi:MAG: membrane protein insertase YidC [Deltaproteobacteria bacterium]|nr:membrane protein insertase YidC [Deltaproteobacteria bacterium]